MQQPPIYLDINNNKSIINALKAGEEYVFDAVYRHYFRRLCAFCSQYVSEQEEIEEIVQDTMMWLWENRCNLMEELTLKTLLFTIVKNKALNRISRSDEKYIRRLQKNSRKNSTILTFIWKMSCSAFMRML